MYKRGSHIGLTSDYSIPDLLIYAMEGTSVHLRTRPWSAFQKKVVFDQVSTDSNNPFTPKTLFSCQSFEIISRRTLGGEITYSILKYRIFLKTFIGMLTQSAES